MSCNCNNNSSSCSSCFNGVEIPVGPQGDRGEQGIQGEVGEQGEQGEQGPAGENGTNGINGTNAFKFTKEFNTNLDGSVITITQAELLSCEQLPEGCLYNGISPNFTDLHVQVWIRSNDGGLGTNWSLGDSSNISYIRINATTGVISIALTGGSIDVIARVVVIG